MAVSRGLLLMAPFIVSAMAIDPGDGSGRAATPVRAQAPPTTWELIDIALGAGRIDDETAARYRVFAIFGDSRLPAAFRGAPTPDIPLEALSVRSRLDTFSPQTREELAPFLLRPATPGSWLELTTAGGSPEPEPPAGPAAPPVLPVGSGPAGDGDGPTLAHGSGRVAAPPIQWHTVPAAGGKVKVWAQLRHGGDSLKAEQIANAVTTTIWPKLTGLFWEPLGDGGLDDNGGDSALDIYLVRPSFPPDPDRTWEGLADYADAANQCGESPRFLLIDSRYPIGGPTAVGLVQTVAHELTHAITATKEWMNYDCPEYRWIQEATAVWAEDWTYPRAQSEHRRAQQFQIDPRVSLDSERDLHQYGAYLLPFYLVNLGHQDVLPEMWRRFATMKSLDGIDAALRGRGTNLEEEFPKFAVANWNRPPVDDYRQGDALLEVANVGSDSLRVSVSGGSTYEKSMPMGMYYLSTEYVYFQFESDVGSVTFENPLGPIPWAGVWGIEKIRGQWQRPEDWTQTPAQSWCRSQPSEHLEELVLVFTNKQWKDKALRVDPGANPPVLRAYPTGCSAWVGTVTARLDGNLGSVTISESATASVRFEPDPDLTDPTRPVEYWMAVSGSVQWRVTVSGECTGSFSGTVPLLPGYPGGSRQAILHVADEGDGLRYTADLGPWPDPYNEPNMWQCAGGNTVPAPLYGVSLWWGTDPGGHLVSPDGKTLSDTWEYDLGNGLVVKWSWRFRYQ